MPAGLYGTSRGYPHPRSAGIRRPGGGGGAPIAQEFPGAWLILGDPYATDFEPVTQSDRVLWRDTSGCGNHAWNKTSGAIGPWDTQFPTTSTIDGHLVPAFDGSDDSLAGWLTSTPTGENLLLQSETLTGWTLTGVDLSAGPTPPAPYTQSALITENISSSLHHASTAPSNTHYLNTYPYWAKACIYRNAGTGVALVGIDNKLYFWIDLVTGVITDGGFTYLVNPFSVDKGGGWWEVYFQYASNSTAAGNEFYVRSVTNVGATSNAGDPGRSLAITGVQVSSARSLIDLPIYGKAIASYKVNPTFTACTMTVVAKSISGGPRAILDLCTTSAFLTNTGPRCGTDTAVFHTNRLKDSIGSDVNYSRALGNIDCHTMIADPATNSLRIFRNGVETLSTTCASWAKPAFAYRIGRLFQNLWHLAGDIHFVSLWPLAQDYLTFPTAISNKLRAGPAFPSIAA